MWYKFFFTNFILTNLFIIDDNQKPTTRWARTQGIQDSSRTWKKNENEIE